MDRMTIYHGSPKRIESPSFDYKNRNSDYGDAFYCTQDIYAAKEWGNKNTTNGFVNVYEFDGRGLNVLDLTDKNKYSVLHWISVLMHFRDLDIEFKDTYKRELEFLEKNYYVDVTKYDVIIGFRADDSYFKFPLCFVRSEIRLEKLEEIYMLGYLGSQIAIKSEKAFKRLKYIKTIEVEPIYKDKYQRRIIDADRRFEEIRKNERWLDGTRLIDLVKQNG